MHNRQGRFPAADGTVIFYRSWSPPEPRALVILVHGLAEHSGRYEHFARFLAGHGIATFANDLPSHGLSAGTRGHVGDFTQYTDVLGQMLGLARTSHPDLPFVLFGHSMGGLIAASFLEQRQHEFAAAVLSGPAIQSPQKPSALAMLIVRMLAAVVPRFEVQALDATGISRDSRVVRAYNKDPLVYRGKGTAGLAAALVTAMQNVIGEAATIDIPLLILHGGSDRLTSVAGSERLFESVGSADKKLTIYDGLFHEILNEPERDKVMADILAWLEPRLEQAAVPA